MNQSQLKRSNVGLPERPRTEEQRKARHRLRRSTRVPTPVLVGALIAAVALVAIIVRASYQMTIRTEQITIDLRPHEAP